MHLKRPASTSESSLVKLKHANLLLSPKIANESSKMIWLFICLLLAIVLIVGYLTYQVVHNLIQLDKILHFNQLLDDL